MLKSLDVLIGLSAIMLALSMAVTVITQFVTTVFNTRGRHLVRGLADLIRQLDPDLTTDVADAVATKLLTHPLVSGATSRLASVVHREEFTALLLQLAAGDKRHPLDEANRTILEDVLKRNGIEKPGETLARIRQVTLDLELADSSLATDVRQARAILLEAKSAFVGKINNWFDQTIDRTSERFTFSTRGITFAAATLVAVVFQVDTLMLVNRLSVDDKLREQFVAQAGAMVQGGQPAGAPGGGVSEMTGTGAATPGSGTPESTTPVVIDRQYLTFLRDNALLTAPSLGPDWMRHWTAVNPAGLAMTALLLSLGAPFWYGALGQLLQLRSVIAKKDDQQRTGRQTKTAA